MIPSENPIGDQLKKAKESGIEIPVDDLETLKKLKAKRDEVRDRSYLEEVTTIFSLRDEK